MTHSKEPDENELKWRSRPLIRRPKPAKKRPTSPDPTGQELHKLSQAAAVETPEELARRLSKLHEGLQDLDEDDGDLPPAS